jgi:hypothetical protein
MSRFRTGLALAILLTLLALPASAVTSKRTNGKGSWSLLSALWNSVTSFFLGNTTDGRCTLDPGGVCLPGGS